MAISVCPHCSSCFVEQEINLCRYCRDRSILEIEAANPRQIVLGELTIRTLFIWSGSSLWSSIIYAQKQGRAPRLTHLLSKALARDPHSSIGGAVLVPVPSHSGQRDHAQLLAEELSLILGLPVENCLERAGIGPAQKTLPRKERQHQSFRGRSLDARIKIILVDDVITTGATARACFRALNAPQRFEVWCLGCRQ